MGPVRVPGATGCVRSLAEGCSGCRTGVWCFAVSWCCRHKCRWFKERAVEESPVSCRKVSFLCLSTTGLNFSPAAFLPVLVTGDGCSKACWVPPGTLQLCGDAATQTSGGALVLVTPPFLFFPPYFKCFRKDLFSKTMENCSLKMGKLQSKLIKTK